MTDLAGSFAGGEARISKEPAIFSRREKAEWRSNGATFAVRASTTMGNMGHPVGRRAVAFIGAAALGLGGFIAATPQQASSAGAPSVSIEMPGAIMRGSLIHAKVVISNGEYVAGAQFTLAYDRGGLAFDGVQSPSDRVALTTIEHAEGLTTGFYAERGAPVSELVTDVVLSPRALGNFELQLRDVVLVDRNGRVIPASVEVESSITVGSSRTRHPAPVAVRSEAPKAALPLEASVSAGAAQAEWTLATEAGSCDGTDCVSIADVQQAATEAGPPSAQSMSGPTVSFVVNTTSDATDSNVGNGVCAISGGGCSLRGAIQEANLSTFPVEIQFDIPGGGLKTLTPASRYPTLTNSVTSVLIDGFSQPGSSPNTDALASNADYGIEIAGQGPSAFDAFLVTGSNFTFRGLNIHSFGRSIWFLGADAHHNTIVGSLIGLLPNGATDPLVTTIASKTCVVIQGGAHHNNVGVPGVANRNVISGCPHQNVATYDNDTDYNVIQNNIVGLDPTGLLRRGAKSHGIDINTWSSYTLIGGSAPGERNVISGNLGNGVEISHGVGTMFNQVVGNFIGTSLDGESISAATAHGQVGVRLEGNPFCSTACDPDISYQSVIDNVIGNASDAGIWIDKGTHHSTVQGNDVGISPSGNDIGNGFSGIRVEAGAFDTVISQNEVAHNDSGIQIIPTGASPPSSVISPTNFNTITQNSIHDNGVGSTAALGIDLAPLGVVNNSGNADPDVNEAIVGPTLSNATSASVDAQTCGSCTIELFVADRPASQFGSGITYITTGVANSSGFARLPVPAFAQGSPVTATTTNPSGSTSEFSRNVAIPLPDPGNVAPSAVMSVSCSHLTCTFGSTGSGDPDGYIVQYSWDFGDGQTASGPTAVHTYSVGGDFTVALTVTDNDAATGSVYATATSVNLAPTASFSGSCAFQLCTFDASASTDPDAPIESYAWDFGDSTTGSGVTTTHSFAASGTYTVNLVVDDGNGATAQTSSQFTVTVLPLGTLGFDAFGRTTTNAWGSADIGGPWTLSSAPADYSVGSGTGRIISATAGAARIAYLPSTLVMDSDTVVDISTNKAPTGGTYGEVAGLTARRQGTTLEYRLRLRFPPGGGVKLSLAKVVNSSTEVQIGSEINVAGATYATGRLFTTRLRVTGTNPTTLEAKAWTTGTAEPGAWGIVAMDSQPELQVAGAHGVRTYLSGSATNAPVTTTLDNYRMQVVNTAPTAAYSASCVNSTCSFNAAASTDSDGTIQTYSWDYGDGSNGTGLTASHDYGSAFGTYQPVLTVTDNYGATDTESQSLDVVNEAPTASFTSDCVDLTCTFDGSGSVDPDGSLTNYDWDFGDGLGGTGVSVVHTFAGPDIYSIVLNVTDDDAAQDADSQTITVLGPNALPTSTYGYSCVLLTCSFDGSGSTDSDGVIQSYAWDFGDGNTATGPTATHTFGFTNSFDVQLTVIDDRGGADAETQSIAVVGPNVGPTAQATVTCTAMSCNYDSVGSFDPDGVISTYLWTFGDGTSATTAVASHSYSIAGTWPVTLTLVDDDGEPTSIQRFAVVAPVLPTFVTGNDDFTRTLSSQWGNANSGGTWTNTGTANNFNVNGTVGTQRTPTIGSGMASALNGLVGNDLDVRVRIAADKAATGSGHWSNVTVRKVATNQEYRVRVKTNSSGVFLAAAKLAGSSNSTLIGAEISTGLAYVPNQFYRVRAQAVGVNPTTIRAKVWVDGTSEPAAWLLVRTDSTASIQGAGAVGLSSYDAGTVAPVIFSFDDFVVGPANTAPVASFVVSCTAMTCDNDAAASSDDVAIASYIWSFGDGGTGIGVNPAHIYSAPGTYTVTLTVVDNTGLASVTTRVAVVNGPPVAAFIHNCTSLLCDFDASSSSDPEGSIASYEWAFSDGGSAVGVTAQHTFATSGTFDVLLTVTDALGLTDTETVSVQVNTPPVASFTSVCANYDCQFDASASSDIDGTIQSYSWDFGDGQFDTGVSPTHTYAAAGSYVVTLTVTDDQSATDDEVSAAVANVAPAASFGEVCTELSCDFDGSASTDTDGIIASYAWDFGDASASGTGAQPNHVYAAAGTYSVAFTITDDLGGTNTTLHDVVVNSAPTAAFTVSCSEYLCDFDAATSVDPGGSIVTYDWDLGDAQNAAGVAPTHTYAAAGLYVVTLTVTDDVGATDSFTANAIANVAPTASFSEVCAALTCDVDAATSADADGVVVGYLWDFGDGATSTTASASHAYATGGSYLVTLTVTDDLGGTDSTSLTVSVNAPPVAAFPPNCTLLSCTFDAAASGDPDGTIVSYVWTLGDGGTATGVTTNHTYALAGEWPVTLTVVDDDGASTTVSALIVVAPAVSPTLFASDAFSRTTTSGWGTSDLGGVWTTPGTASNFGVNGGSAKMTIPSSGTNLAARLATVSGTDLDVQTKVSFNVAQTGAGSWASISGRYIATSQEYRARIRFSSASVHAAAYRQAGGAAQVIGSEVSTGLSATVNAVYRVRMNVSGTNPTTIRIKVWMDGTSEPSSWLVSVTDSTASLQVAGVAGLQGYSANQSYPLVFSFDDFAVRPANLPPVAAFTADCAGALTCNVDASGSIDDDSIVSYEWVWGDGTVTTGVTSSHVYLVPGPRSVTLTVTDNLGVKTVLAQSVTVT